MVLIAVRHVGIHANVVLTPVCPKKEAGDGKGMDDLRN